MTTELDNACFLDQESVRTLDDVLTFWMPMGTKNGVYSVVKKYIQARCHIIAQVSWSCNGLNWVALYLLILHRCVQNMPLVPLGCDFDCYA